MNRKSISRLAFAIVILCFCLSTFVSLWSLRIMAQQNLEAMGETITGRIYDAISGELSEPITVARTMASDTFLIDALKRESRFSEGKAEKMIADYLSGIKDGLDCEAAFVVSEASRHYYSYAGVNKRMDLENSARDQWYVDFVSSGAPYALDVDRDEVSQDKWTVFVDARIADENGALLGVCGVGAHMTGTRALHAASFTDQSTGLLNRRAFEEEKARLSMSSLREDFAYVTADVNGLKTVNDNLGHAAGDELIQGAAECLRGCLGRYGDIYRIGGDEFAAMLYLSPEQLENAVKALDEATARWSGKLVPELSISCGYATSREFPSENIAELGRISDERMYAAKEAHYRRTGKARRI